MCGIVGYCMERPDQGAEDSLRRAVATLKHRGPDGAGYHFSSRVGLGHARLAVIDVHTGDQPLYNEDDSLVTIVNGEFYNYRELNRFLETKGHRFKTGSDSETLLHLYEDLDLPDCLNRLNGMWALALWDEKRQRLILSRDRAGKKPLYYIHDQGRLVFASEIKALLAFPDVDRTMDETGLALYLKYGYIPVPYSIYKSIRKFPAASYCVYESGRLTIAPYWRLPDQIDDSRSEAKWVEELDEVLDDAVRLRLVSDVPLGGFLSGGLDSSLIVSNMARHIQGHVTTVCIGFDDQSYDESEDADTVARFLGVENHTHRVDFHDLEKVPELAAHFDEPFADASFLPTWHLCKATREHVTVSLSGDGGDELFGGYRRYLAGKLIHFYLSLPRSLRRSLVEPIVDRLPAPGGYYGRSWSKKSKLFVGAAMRIEQAPLAIGPHLFNDDELIRLFPGMSIPELDQDPLLGAALRVQGGNLVDAMQRTDFMTYLADDILVKVDRMSMYHGLEVRCPFLDHRVVELAFQMPVNFKIKGFNTKYILRRLAQRQLPTRTVKKSKQGFMVPLDIWFRGQLKGFIYDNLNHCQALWSRSEALRLLEEHLSVRQDHALKLWALAVLGLWNQRQ